MGGSYSTGTESLYLKISKEIKDLIYKVKDWENDDACEKLSVVYMNKLLQFEKNDIQDASKYIGINITNAEDKKKMCEKIISHYKQRLELLNKIKKSLEANHSKIHSAVNGPVCRNVQDSVLNLADCKEKNGTWFTQEEYVANIQNIKNNGDYNIFYEHVDSLNKSWRHGLKKLKKIVFKIKKDLESNSISNAKFNAIKEYTSVVISKMEKLTNVYYLLVINQGV